MLKRVVGYGLVMVLAAAVALTIAGVVVKKKNTGRIAPGVTVCGRDLSGLTMAEAEAVVRELVPNCVTELRCRFLPEMREEIEDCVQEFHSESEYKETEDVHLTVSEKEVCLTVRRPLFRIDVEASLQAVTEKNAEVKVWEWLYGAVTGRPVSVRQADAVFVWEEELFREYLAVLKEVVEREKREATVSWEKGHLVVSKSKRGFRLDTEVLQRDAERVTAEVAARLKSGPVEGLVLRFSLTGTALMPNLSTAQAEKCNTVLGVFTTAYMGAGNGRVQNIENGAEKLHAKVVLPGEAFSVATALMPFTEENGYAPGGTYIDGQLSESIGGGVCQLSTTLYNALLQTRLEIVERHPHSMPVGYVPLGQDAAIAGDYKDLKFKNTTNVPVLLLCEVTGEVVKVTVYGTEEAQRGKVTFERVIRSEDEEKVTVEVYRTETGADGEEKRERVSEDVYRVK